MTKRFDEEVRVERDGGMPSGFEWRGRRYRVVDVIGRWRIEGRWWEDGRDREYCQIERLNNLETLPPKGFTVVAFPVKIAGSTKPFVDFR